MFRTRIDAEVSKLNAAQRSARQHALDRLFDDALGETPLHDRFRRTVLDAADEAGVVVIDLIIALPPRQHGLGGIDDDDIVTVIDMRRIRCLVLSTEAQCHDGCKPADHEPRGVDGHPFLFNVGSLGRVSLHGLFPEKSSSPSREAARYVADAVHSGQRSCINYIYYRLDTYIIGNFVPAAKLYGME